MCLCVQTGLQARVAEIRRELSDLVVRQEALKSRMKTARDQHSLATLDALRSQFEACAALQLRLRMEQSAIISSSKHKYVCVLENARVH